eukprot:gene7239-16909_t
MSPACTVITESILLRRGHSNMDLVITVHTVSQVHSVLESAQYTLWMFFSRSENISHCLLSVSLSYLPDMARRIIKAFVALS